MVSPVQKIIGVFLTIIMAAALVPSALTSFNAANTSGWTTEQTALWGVIGILVIVAIIVVLIPSE